ncbi:MAG: hypothetical protein ACODAQ_02730 [Phycisphaeraceae bacterium]
MKLGIAISTVILVAFVGVLVALNVGAAPSEPTDATSPEHLRRVALPGDLPAVHESIDGQNGGGDAEPTYRAAIRHWRANESALSRQASERPEAAVRELRERMVEAMGAGHVSEGFLDQYLPLAPAAGPRFDAALEWIQRIMLDEAERLVEEANGAAAGREAALAVWVMGRRAFEHNERLFNRRQGLAMMRAAGAVLGAHGAAMDIDTAALSAWAAALEQVQSAWRPKLEVLLSIDPHAADLIRIAEQDEDRTFRIEATLRLGIAKYTADTEADREAAQGAIDALMASDDAKIAEAARAADALTRQELRRIR